MTSTRALAPELADVARTQLQENDDQSAETIKAFRQWIEEQDYLKARIDDQFLVAFLRFSHWDLEAAQQRLLFYYTYKTNERGLLKNHYIDDKLWDISRSGIFATLPNPIGPGGPRIHFTRMGLVDTSKYTVSECFRFHTFRAEIEINTDDNWNIAGVVEILDFTKISYSLLLQFDAGLFRRMNSFLEHGIPANLIATHIVNASKETQFVLNLLRGVMRQKELLHIHPNVESLQRAIGKEYLPSELGGENGTIDEAVSGFLLKLKDYENYFKEDEKYGVDEALRLEKEKQKAANAALLQANTEASFQKLEID